MSRGVDEEVARVIAESYGHDLEFRQRQSPPQNLGVTPVEEVVSLFEGLEASRQEAHEREWRRETAIARLETYAEGQEYRMALNECGTWHDPTGETNAKGLRRILFVNVDGDLICFEGTGFGIKKDDNTVDPISAREVIELADLAGLRPSISWVNDTLIPYITGT